MTGAYEAVQAADRYREMAEQSLRGVTTSEFQTDEVMVQYAIACVLLSISYEMRSN